jgi:non-canonical (house-cleaning) NTP pyrophosphatase
MEGGVYQDQIGEEYWLIGVVYIENREWKGEYGYSAHLKVPNKIREWLFDWSWRDLEQIVHALWWKKDVWDKEGSYGTWTDGMLTRKEQFIMATQCAIAPFFNTFYQF